MAFVTPENVVYPIALLMMITLLRRLEALKKVYNMDIAKHE